MTPPTDLSQKRRPRAALCRHKSTMTSSLLVRGLDFSMETWYKLFVSLGEYASGQGSTRDFKEDIVENQPFEVVKGAWVMVPDYALAVEMAKKRSANTSDWVVRLRREKSAEEHAYTFYRAGEGESGRGFVLFLDVRPKAGDKITILWCGDTAAGGEVYQPAGDGSRQFIRRAT